MLRRLLFPILLILIFASCAKKEEVTAPSGDGTYFSIKQFIGDQWKTYKGQPFGLEKVVTLNGKKDSSYTTAFDAEWGAIIKPFFESDISDPKYVGQYTYSAFKDDATYTLNLYYEANDPKLSTRKLHIMVDDVTAKVKSIYIETESKNLLRKLLYIPQRIISIQEFENMSSSNAKQLHIEYRFLHQ